MDTTQLAAVAGVILSLVFSYVPGAKGWFDGLSTDVKRVVVGVSLVVVAVAAFALTCGGVIGVAIVCTKSGALDLLAALIAALVANQGTYLITKG